MHYKVSVDNRYLFSNLGDASYNSLSCCFSQIHTVIKSINTFIKKLH
jgi:hypothetical protein